MGLTTWKNSPDEKILKRDVTVAKNYLTREELSELNSVWLTCTWIMLKIRPEDTDPCHERLDR